MQFFNDNYIQKWRRSQYGSSVGMLKESYVEDSMESLYENFSAHPEAAKKYDIFLSHRYEDKKYVRDLLEILYKKYKLSVYVDWIVHPDLDRTNVTKATASVIREDMKRCKSLWFLTSKTSETSKWMPWEAGFMDGYNGNVLICPYINEGYFQGAEYLSLYPYVRPSQTKESKRDCIAVHDNHDCVTFESWLNRSK